MTDTGHHIKKNFYHVLLDYMKYRKTLGENMNSDELKFCFMLHDEVQNEIQKVEVADLFEWLQDGSFEKTDKLYISFLVKEY
jgi:hypothetical protein